MKHVSGSIKKVNLGKPINLMSSKKQRMNQLEERNSELAKEILLNEAAIYKAEKEIDNIDADLVDHEHIQKYMVKLNIS